MPLNFPVAGSLIVTPGSQWRTFVHYTDNRIHQLVLYDPNSLTYTDSLVGGPTAKPDSPVAAITWGSNPCNIRVYYITEESKLQEMWWTGGLIP